MRTVLSLVSVTGKPQSALIVQNGRVHSIARSPDVCSIVPRKVNPFGLEFGRDVSVAENPSCARNIFVERLENVAVAYAHSRDRLEEIIRCVAFVTGDLTRSRPLARLAIRGQR
jgi:hypothetical protein